MSGKRLIIPLFILALLFTGLFTSRNDLATATPDQSINQTAAAVQWQQILNSKGYWCGAMDGILGFPAYQAVIRFQIDYNLIADGLIGLRARQAPSLALINTAPAPTPVLAENPAPPANSAAKPSNSVNSAPVPVKPVEKPAVKVAEKPAAVSRGTSSTSGQGKVITMVATGYDGCYECNKPYYGYPSYIGLPLERGIVAVDPKVIPMGTRLYVEGYGNAIAADQGNAIKENRIDLFFDTHQQALNWGMKTVKVTILGK